MNRYGVLLLLATLLSVGIYFTTTIHCWMTNQYEKDNIDAGMCFFAVLFPVMIPLGLTFFYLNWVGIQFFINN